MQIELLPDCLQSVSYRTPRSAEISILPEKLPSNGAILSTAVAVLGLASVNMFFFISRIPAEFRMLLDATFFANYVSMLTFTLAAAFFMSRLTIAAFLNPTIRLLRFLLLRRGWTLFHKFVRTTDRFLRRFSQLILVVSGCVFFVFLRFGLSGGVIALTSAVNVLLIWAITLSFGIRNSSQGMIARFMRQASNSPDRSLSAGLILLSVFSAILGITGARENMRNTILVRSDTGEEVGALIAATGNGLIVLEGFDYDTEWIGTSEPQEYRFAFLPFSSSITYATKSRHLYYNPSPYECVVPGCR